MPGEGGGAGKSGNAGWKRLDGGAGDRERFCAEVVAEGTVEDCDGVVAGGLMLCAGERLAADASGWGSDTRTAVLATLVVGFGSRITVFESSFDDPGVTTAFRRAAPALTFALTAFAFGFSGGGLPQKPNVKSTLELVAGNRMCYSRRNLGWRCQLFLHNFRL